MVGGIEDDREELLAVGVADGAGHPAPVVLTGAVVEELVEGVVGPVERETDLRHGWVPSWGFADGGCAGPAAPAAPRPAPRTVCGGRGLGATVGAGTCGSGRLGAAGRGAARRREVGAARLQLGRQPAARGEEHAVRHFQAGEGVPGGRRDGKAARGRRMPRRRWGVRRRRRARWPATTPPRAHRQPGPGAGRPGVPRSSPRGGRSACGTGTPGWWWRSRLRSPRGMSEPPPRSWGGGRGCGTGGGRCGAAPGGWGTARCAGPAAPAAPSSPAARCAAAGGWGRRPVAGNRVGQAASAAARLRARRAATAPRYDAAAFRVFAFNFGLGRPWSLSDCARRLNSFHKRSSSRSSLRACWSAAAAASSAVGLLDLGRVQFRRGPAAADHVHVRGRVALALPQRGLLARRPHRAGRARPEQLLPAREPGSGVLACPCAASHPGPEPPGPVDAHQAPAATVRRSCGSRCASGREDGGVGLGSPGLDRRYAGKSTSFPSQWDSGFGRDQQRPPGCLPGAVVVSCCTSSHGPGHPFCCGVAGAVVDRAEVVSPGGAGASWCSRRRCVSGAIPPSPAGSSARVPSRTGRRRSRPCSSSGAPRPRREPDRPRARWRASR